MTNTLRRTLACTTLYYAFISVSCSPSPDVNVDAGYGASMSARSEPMVSRLEQLELRVDALEEIRREAHDATNRQVDHASQKAVSPSVFDKTGTPRFQFVSSVASKKFHRRDCAWATKISSKNLVLVENMDYATKMGLAACKVCKPE